MPNGLKTIFYGINMLLVIAAIVTVLRSRKSPSSVLAWILSLMAVPVLGLAAYLLLGYDWRKRKLVRLVPEEVFSEHLNGILNRQGALVEPMLHSPETETRRIGRNIHLLSKATSAPVTVGNEVRSYFNGGDKFADLCRDLESAKKSIHMEYYIWRSDELGRRILDILVRKKAEGVEVRLIFDGLGSFGTVSYAHRRAMKDAGIEYAFFLDLRQPDRPIQNQLQKPS